MGKLRPTRKVSDWIGGIQTHALMLQISEKLQKGQLLIAEPTIIGDLSFNRSVILLAYHTKDGSVGFILNKPLKYDIRDLKYIMEAQ